MREISKETFNFYVLNLCKRGKTFYTETKRDTNGLYIDNRLIILNKNQRKRFTEDKKQLKSMVNIFAQVQKSINTHLKQVQFEVPVVEQRFSSSKNNSKKWNNMAEGEIFYYVDVNHCYWRIAFLKGYINKNLYTKVLANDKLKTARNMSLSLIVAPKKRKYYLNGKFSHDITEDKTMFQTIYSNIRFISYNLMGDAMELAKGSFIGYRTDGIMISKRAVKKVTEFLEDKGFNFTVVECCKLDNNHYLYNNKDKKKY